MLIPWKEILLVGFIVILTISISQIQIKNEYVKYISTHPTFRFFMVFSLAMLVFSMDVGPDYHVGIRIISALVIAGLFEIFFSGNVTMLSLEKPEKDIPTDVSDYPETG
jgi:uncharacterized membrane protein YgdD (TMEM256/DUF423 family)